MDWVGGESSWKSLGGLSMSNKELSYGTVEQEKKEENVVLSILFVTLTSASITGYNLIA